MGRSNLTRAYSQAYLFPEIMPEKTTRDGTSSTFIDNMRLPVHRWIRFSAGFSGAWAQHLIENTVSRGKEIRVFDPFAGSGTTLVAAESAGVVSCGVEAHPFIYRIAEAKLARWSDVTLYRKRIQSIKKEAQRIKPDLAPYPKLIRECYTNESLEALDCLRRSVEQQLDDSETSKLVWLTLVGILRKCSHAGTAQWQYVLPKKSKKTPSDPFSAFDSTARMMMADMATSTFDHEFAAGLHQGDARECAEIPDCFANLVVTSPPYPNNYDYADATRLEMCFFQEIQGWGDLQSKVRSNLVRSCTQHVPEKAVDLPDVLSKPILNPILKEIQSVCDELAQVRMTKGGKKTYHLMVACYFHDLAQVWMALRRVCDTPSTVCFVIGDSAPYGVYVPVIEWLGKLALSAGFRSYRFEKTRDRNLKWKNRKHRVPLCEGRLWVEG